MNEQFNIRVSTASDHIAIAALYHEAFAGEDLGRLIGDLLAGRDDVLSLVCDENNDITGHILFSQCSIDASPTRAALLGPLAVLPVRQRRGTGNALVRDGLARLADDDVSHVFVLGDPAYYGRFGFKSEADVAPPYPLVAEWRAAWQSHCLAEGVSRPCGQLVVPEPWQQPALWAPQDSDAKEAHET